MNKIIAVFGLSGVLNWLSQFRVSDFTDYCQGLSPVQGACQYAESASAGFPFGYVDKLKEQPGATDAIDSFDWALFSGNWIFWLIIAAILVIGLSKLLELFGKIALVVGIGAAAAVYFGILAI